MDFVLHWLQERQPDVVGLQELKLEDEHFPHLEFQAAGYKAVTHGQKAWNGVAILSRAECGACVRGLPGEEEFGSRLITAEVEGVTFTTVYVPNGKSVHHEDFPRKLAWLESLRAHLKSTLDPEKPALLCGDFNICPAPIDSWNEKGLTGKIFHTDEERARFRAILECGYLDVFRERNPDVKAFSWWDYRGGAFHRGMGLRIDFLLATPPLLSRVKSVEIDREYRKKKGEFTASDHAPVMMDVD